MSFRFTIQYQLGHQTGTKEIMAENQQQAITRLWEEITKTIGYIAYNAYKSASIVSVQM
ncbi:MAG: hypothetical protein JXQ65_06775 [Candidatus Marinimicrobia bacterium]|nr:hypothetical protein [Candidatus Neomarinimicrobiota bacterium]